MPRSTTTIPRRIVGHPMTTAPTHGHPTDQPAALLARPHAGTSRFITEATGAWLRDADGNDYIDLIGSWGPMILGPSRPEVLAAVQEAAVKGFSFGTPSTGEVELAEEIVSRVDPVDQVRLVSSGTEATMSAIRLARGYTGRSKVVKFAGCYHGHV